MNLQFRKVSHDPVSEERGKIPVAHLFSQQHVEVCFIHMLRHSARPAGSQIQRLMQAYRGTRLKFHQREAR